MRCRNRSWATSEAPLAPPNPLPQVAGTLTIWLARLRIPYLRGAWGKSEPTRAQLLYVVDLCHHYQPILSGLLQREIGISAPRPGDQAPGGTDPWMRFGTRWAAGGMGARLALVLVLPVGPGGRLMVDWDRHVPGHVPRHRPAGLGGRALPARCLPLRGRGQGRWERSWGPLGSRRTASKASARCGSGSTGRARARWSSRAHR